MKGKSGEDLVEKQNAEMGLDAGGGGRGDRPMDTRPRTGTSRAHFCGGEADAHFDDGLEVVKILMTAYMSAETGRRSNFRPRGWNIRPGHGKGRLEPRR